MSGEFNHLSACPVYIRTSMPSSLCLQMLQKSNLWYRTLDRSDVFGASPVGIAPAISAFSTWCLASMERAKTAAGWDEKILNRVIWCTFIICLAVFFKVSLAINITILSFTRWRYSNWRLRTQEMSRLSECYLLEPLVTWLPGADREMICLQKISVNKFYEMQRQMSIQKNAKYYQLIFMKELEFPKHANNSLIHHLLRNL